MGNPLLRGDPWKGGGGAPVAAPFPRSRALVRCASSAAIRSDWAGPYASPMSPSVDRARSLGSPDNDARSRYRKSKAELPTHRRLAVAAPGEVHDVVREGAVGDGGRAASGGDVEGFGLNLDEEATVLECFPEPWLHQLAKWCGFSN